MEEQKIYELINENLGFYLATMDGDQPRVRGMMLFRADKNGIVFHTASSFCFLPIITIGVVDYRHCNQKNLKIYLSTLHKSV